MPRFADMATVTRKQIRAFDAEAKEVVELFHAAGWRSYLSGQSHAILYAPDGVTTVSVSGHSRGQRGRMARADLERWLRDNPQPNRHQRHKPLRREMAPGSKRKNKPEHKSQNLPEKENQMVTKFGCPDCPEREPFVSGGALALHRQRSHEGMVCPECGDTFHGGGNSKRYNVHRLEKHGIEPKRKMRLKRVEGKVYPCPWCGVPYPSASAVAGHTKVHRGQPRPAEVPVPVSVPAATNGHAPTETPLVVQAAPAPSPVPQSAALVSTGSAELDEWIAGQNAADLLAGALALLAPPLVGQIERLRRERDELTREVAELRRLKDDHEARAALVLEAMGV